MAANDLADLHSKLEIALRDTTNLTWSDAEIDTALTWAAARMWPRIAKRVRETKDLTTDEDQYTLTTVQEINRIDLIDGLAASTTALVLYPLSAGTWEYWGDNEVLGGTLYVNPRYASTGKSLRIHGWAPYDLVTNLPRERHAQLILAMATSTLAKRELARRYAFKEWQTVNQVQNISVSELIMMVNDAEAREAELFRQLKTWRRPVPAHVGNRTN
jgi:hypothetical protein